MSSKPAESNSKKTTKPSAISKQVLKTNPIPQPVQSTSSSTSAAQSNLTKKLNSSKGKPNQPLRSTKVSQKLVLFPQADSTAETPDTQQDQSYEEEEWQPRIAGVPLPIERTFGSRTPAERMTKDERELALLPRAAAYYTGEGYDLNRLRPFLRQHHRVSPRLYDECLYAAYHFPLRTLRPDKDNLFNIRVRSNVAKPPNSRRNTTDEDFMDYEEDALVDERQDNEEYYPNQKDFYDQDTYYQEQQQDDGYYQEPEQQQHEEQSGQEEQGIFENPFAEEGDKHEEEEEEENQAVQSEEQQQQQQPEQEQKPPREPFKGGEVFIFDYGVVVFWNFRRAEELLMLEDFNQFSLDPFRDNPDEDMQIEELHFQYDTSQLKPRIFNDMITLKSGNHMIKLTISHGLSQSAVVARYEDIMDKTIEDTKYLPKEMAETGRLGKTRAEITKINGELFNLRMNVNLVSNVLGKCLSTIRVDRVLSVCVCI